MTANQNFQMEEITRQTNITGELESWFVFISNNGICIKISVYMQIDANYIILKFCASVVVTFDAIGHQNIDRGG